MWRTANRARPRPDWRLTPAASERSAPLVLRVAEQDLARLVVGDRLAQVRQHLHAALHRGALVDGMEPGFQVRVLGQLDALVLPVAQPRPGGDVRDGVVGA